MDLEVKQDRLSRMLEVIRILRLNAGMAVKDIASQFKTSPEQIYQDFQDLSAAGVPIYLSSNGFQILPSYFDTSNELNVEEAVLLLQGLKNLEEQQVINRVKSEQIQGKLFWAASAVNQKKVQQLKLMVSTPSSLSNPINLQLLDSIHLAIKNKTCVRMLYQSRKSAEPVWRELSPYSQVFRKDTWYAIGYCHRREEVRTFKISRIKEISGADTSYVSDESFDLDEYLLYTWNIIGGEPQVVVIRFDREIGNLILEKQISNGRVWKEGGFVYLKVLVSGLEEISWWIMQYGDHAEVLQPDELRKMLAIRCAKMAAKYKETITRRSSKVIQLY